MKNLRWIALVIFSLFQQIALADSFGGLAYGSSSKKLPKEFKPIEVTMRESGHRLLCYAHPGVRQKFLEIEADSVKYCFIQDRLVMGEVVFSAQANFESLYDYMSEKHNQPDQIKVPGLKRFIWYWGEQSDETMSVLEFNPRSGTGSMVVTNLGEMDKIELGQN